MTLVVAWVVFPLVLALLALGCGRLLELAAGTRLPGVLLLPCGLAVIVVAAGLATMTAATAQLATPAVVGLAVAGLVLAPPRRVREPWALAAAGGVFAVFAAPVVVSGQATFAGYLTLDDTATWFALTDRVMEHGRSLAGLAPSSYEATLSNYLALGTPVGANLPLGVGAEIVGRDVAWLFQPYLAFLGAMLALSLYALVARLIASPALRALAVFVAAQAALLYAYSLWGSIKELAAASIIALTAALAVPLLLERSAVRRVLPLAIASAALVAVLSVGGAVWLAPMLLPVLVYAIRSRLRGFVMRTAPAFGALALALSLPALVTAGPFLRRTGDTHVFTSATELGNLIRPLSWLQLFGIWPAGDFRLSPTDPAATHVLIAVVAVAAAAGVFVAARRRLWELPLYVWAVAVGCAAVFAVGSPWVEAKALATASPALVLAGLAGAAALFERGRRTEGAVVAAAIAGGVLWSNALAYHDVWLAPRVQLTELEQIGERFAGEGPALMTEYQPYGVRHFLRRLAPEGASELRRRVVPLRTGGVVPTGGFADVDELALDGLLVYRTLVLARSPEASRPPSVYRLVWSGRYYEVWQRPDTPVARIFAHLPLGAPLQAGATPSCRDVLALARRARGGRLAAVLRPPDLVLDAARSTYPPAWQLSGGVPNLVYPHGSGALEGSLAVPADGRYGIWIGGSFRGRVEVLVDGRATGAAQDRIEHPGWYTPLGELELRPGEHRVMLRYDTGGLRPGSGGRPFGLGPLVLSTATADLPVTYVLPADARSLCGKRLDWIEAASAYSSS
jgi:hypothetical protein